MTFTRLKELRKKNNLTQCDIAIILNVNPSNYSRWETGKELIPLTKLNILCNYFKVDMDYIVGFTDEINFKKKTNLNKIKIGNKLKKIRKKNNLTQENLAQFLNTTHSTISAYESGKTLILTVYAYKICLKYNVSLSWLCYK